ncbi:hypothetical protein BT96DRAFT_984004 [Gymnopus androsaceus JB14]|uniref:HNH nuclease domain-containing protein n=1 Tax=Gymnopus androsaceus JB14 TaxID=1447944 RepID=A0A6A4IDZ3_9AGAR|nr:hypothetical protein BT96DRAFT_984004 [Gymnopus androsaceus JB14]
MSSPPPEHIWLFIESVPSDPEALYLEIPLNRIRANCSKPAKYLLFIAYAITALDGTITLAPQNQLIADDNQLEDQAIYIFNPGNEQTKKLPRTEWGGSQSKRDNQGYTQAIHTISFARGDQWLLQIIAERSGFEGDEGVNGMESIDDVRNGLCGDIEFHIAFDRNELGVIKTQSYSRHGRHSICSDAYFSCTHFLSP